MKIFNLRNETLLIFLVIMVAVLPVNLKSNSIKFSKISDPDGILNGTVLEIFQDSRGFIWIGSDTGGLIRNDVNNFKSYISDHTSRSSINNNSVHSIIEDMEGNLWVGTDSGLNKFEIRTEKFTFYRNDLIKSEVGIESLCMDGDSKLWVGTLGEGMFLFDLKSESYKNNFRMSENSSIGIVDNHVLTILKDRQKNIWAGTKNGISILKNGSSEIVNISDIDNRIYKKILFTIFDIAEADDGSIWIGSNQGLIRYKDKFEITEFGDLKNKGNNIAPGFFNITSLKVDEKNNLWIGTTHGLINYEIGKGLYSYFRNDPEDEYSISGNRITYLFIDKSKNLWIGLGGRNNINIYDRKLEAFGHLTVKGLNKDINFINSFAQIGSGDIFIGSDKGLLRWRRKGRSSQDDFLRSTEVVFPIYTKVLSRSYIYPDILWLGTVIGIKAYNHEDGSLSSNFPDLEKKLNRKVIFSLLEDKEGILWIGTYREGLSNYNLKTGELIDFCQSLNKNKCITDNCITAIAEDPEGNIWIGTAGNGVSKFNKKTGLFKKFIAGNSQENNLSSNNILALHSDQNCLWIGTNGGGLNKFDLKTEKFVYYSKNDGLCNNVVYSIINDNKNKIWVGTNNGLSCFDIATKSFRNYFSYNGLQDNEFNHNAAFKTWEGELAFGGLNGFNLFKSSDIERKESISEIFFTDFQVFYEEIPIDRRSDILCQSILFCEKIQLGYKQNYLTFHFTSLNYSSSSGVNYSYYMEGLSNKWVSLGQKNEISLPFIKPGDYKLIIRASIGNSVDKVVSKSIHIEIIPPFWMTWWFKVMMFITITGFLIFLLYVRKKNRIKNLRTEEAARKYFLNSGLSSRESEIVLLIIKGYSNKQLEDKLFLSYGTIKNHVYSIYKKLNIKNRAELVNIFKNIIPDRDHHLY